MPVNCCLASTPCMLCHSFIHVNIPDESPAFRVVQAAAAVGALDGPGIGRHCIARIGKGSTAQEANTALLPWPACARRSLLARGEGEGAVAASDRTVGTCGSGQLWSMMQYGQQPGSTVRERELVRPRVRWLPCC